MGWEAVAALCSELERSGAALAGLGFRLEGAGLAGADAEDASLAGLTFFAILLSLAILGLFLAATM
jgi:hypothetical protein